MLGLEYFAAAFITLVALHIIDPPQEETSSSETHIQEEDK